MLKKSYKRFYTFIFNEKNGRELIFQQFYYIFKNEFVQF
ncbi:hypothetical protein LEP1GSC073_3553 [Leptospira noguchii str. Cascata]|nr:hypothetical protein LEP1GSC073_3553 [Leptospira noguchii str. Cascata]